MKRFILALMLGVTSFGANAATIGFTIDVFPAQDIQSTPIWPSDCPGNCNHVAFQILNDSSTASITQFSVTIGDTAYNYDGVVVLDDGGVGYTLTSPVDAGGGGFRSDELSFAYAGFSTASNFLFRVDVDPDSTDSYVDFRNIFFGNGSAPNAAASITFSDGQTLVAAFPENPELVDGYIYRLTAEASAVPIPAAAWLFGSALGLMSLVRRKM